MTHPEMKISRMSLFLKSKWTLTPVLAPGASETQTTLIFYF
jgi:hypothetical protein